MSEGKFTLSQEDFARCFINGWIVDGRDGGLIVGRRHLEGHILMFQPAGELGEFEQFGFVEGGEYLMSKDATELHFDRLLEINSDKAPCDTEIVYSADSQIINTRAEPHDKFLIVHSQFIINREATKRHFKELQELNQPNRYYRGRVLTDETIELITTPGFVQY
ncbi:hypothetical protein FEM54_06045 [Pseudomonas edaphica]|uniref:Uncharacterized protein n=1 Tax=Pseudomonas edaphica TaxID=2006980 RepID=A0ABY2U910_9PSED|nr:hypothetical protein [Pseudomonas edaphica]TLG92979.1 hypothetical protein FEM54_06045 [Pseudomonas edaphica]